MAHGIFAADESSPIRNQGLGLSAGRAMDLCALGFNSSRPPAAFQLGLDSAGYNGKNLGYVLKVIAAKRRRRPESKGCIGSGFLLVASGGPARRFEFGKSIFGQVPTA